MKRIGILTGGGDCAGLNATIASIVKTGIKDEVEFVGFLRGWNGVLDKQYKTLTQEDVEDISNSGGTILGTTNKGRFAAKVGSGDSQSIDPDVLAEAKQNLDELNIDGLIVIGGDGTLSGALQLANIGVNVVGVPKTIDNDLSSTDKTFGFSTAVDVAVEAIDRIHTTASSHDRVFFVECMGRHAGWLTLEAGLAADANAILLPEFPINIDELIAFIDSRERKQLPTVIAVSEGIKIPRKFDELADQDLTQEIKLAGASKALMTAIENRLPGKYDMRHAILGHVQRGGQPNAEDRSLAKRYGVAAYEAYRDCEFKNMVRLRNGNIETTPIETATRELNLVTESNSTYKTAQKLGVYINHA